MKYSKKLFIILDLFENSVSKMSIKMFQLYYFERSCGLLRIQNRFFLYLF